MKQEVVNIYMMPGMAANPSIFENINSLKRHLKFIG